MDLDGVEEFSKSISCQLPNYPKKLEQEKTSQKSPICFSLHIHSNVLKKLPDLFEEAVFIERALSG